MWLQRIVPQYLRRQWEWEHLSDHPWWFHLIVGLDRQLILKAYLFPPLERFIRATDFVFDTSNCIWLIGYTSIYFAHTNPVLNLFCDKRFLLCQKCNLVFLFWKIIVFLHCRRAARLHLRSKRRRIAYREMCAADYGTRSDYRRWSGFCKLLLRCSITFFSSYFNRRFLRTSKLPSGKTCSRKKEKHLVILCESCEKKKRELNSFILNRVAQINRG